MLNLMIHHCLIIWMYCIIGSILVMIFVCFYIGELQVDNIIVSNKCILYSMNNGYIIH